ncbi:up-regulator of cell proliferation-like isoform X2 [Trematomus bernacchii]|uniref:up-regulator of cell proliferation-like isoform X2 n=1 Tax=Trematomus bernacchii TaxID=40690 RepID=UPI00146ADC25|nr:up-regulator of cell proliferation-like isoform X2 [Trematomus bernacchii]
MSTNTVLLTFLSKLGLETFYPNKLTLQSLLEINKNSINEEPASSVQKIPWCFLRKLFKLNAECRGCTQVSNSDDNEESRDPFDLDLYTSDESADDRINPLDLITALFLCADSFLQQEMALKMSMCQFSVPLLMPHVNNSQSTLMLWALRDIVKEWRPQNVSESKGFVENNIVQAEIPFYSFVRLNNCTLSKSQMLNQVLSLSQQNHNIFIHRDMKGGAIKRHIANGLAEVCWYLPRGRDYPDVFPEPIAFANLRGNISESLAQFTFLFHVSTATFVFLDKIEKEEHEILTSLQDVKSKLFLVVNRKDGSAKEDMESVRKTVKELDLPNSSVKVKDPRVNNVEFSDKLSAAINKITVGKPTMDIENMVDKAVDFGLSVDECTSDEQNKASEKIVKGIEVQKIPDYKRKQLPLQGADWKRLSLLEKEECRLKTHGNLEPEEYKSQLLEEKQQIKEKLGKLQLSDDMKTFINQLPKNDSKSRDFFLKWMKLKLDAHSRDQLSSLRHQWTEQSNKENKDVKAIVKLDQELLESSLGLEHYMREMGLIYEFSLKSQNSADEVRRLPGLAAELLLDGYPLELLDGDACNIPEKWVTDVLMELHRKVGEKSRLLVLTVLGVQSTGKSTLLNTMFGVQFAVSSGRCTRGAYMLFLRVDKDMQQQLNCDFIVLIDTEGLKSPQLAQLEDSYEHDNQLATFVIGLSDVTIINVASENYTEMKDILQIAIHAFLRMKEIGKRPICHFVHQNVAGVSAHARTLTERQILLDQLNEMTQIAAKMENKPSIKRFADVLNYDIKENTWNIPGLWHGTPPMASVNTGYSEAVADFKKNLLETVKKDKTDDVSRIPEFLEMVRSLWKAVKYENFIFSFRNTLVAHAYNDLCKKFNQWEWEFKKDLICWQDGAKLQILNSDNKTDLNTLTTMVASQKSKLLAKIEGGQKEMDKKLDEYYKRKDIRVSLIEKYKSDFRISIRKLKEEFQHSVNNALDCALEGKKSSKEAQNIQSKHREMIEEEVTKLLSDPEHRTLSDEQLKRDFQQMWTKVTANVSGLKELNISEKVLEQLRKHFSNRKVNEELQKMKDLKDIGTKPFKVKIELKTILTSLAFCQYKALQSYADTAIESCTLFVCGIAKTKADYHDSFARDLLEKVDDSLKGKSFQLKFEIDLKLHICGIASREFLQMHRNVLSARDPKMQLEKNKPQYLLDFIDLYKKRDDCQRKANALVRLCIKPAVEEYISRHLGTNIMDNVLAGCHSAEYSCRNFFQYNIQKELLQKEDFQRFVKFIGNYEMYVKDFIFQQILEEMSEDNTLFELKSQNLQVIVKKITDATERASKGEDGVLLPDKTESITELIKNMRTFLITDISLSEENEKTALFKIQSTCHPFKESLMKSLSEMNKQLQEEFSKSEDITETVNKLPTKPQDELFKRVFGCGQQCPFCKVPCEAAGKQHEKHFAAVHRPQGLGRYIIVDTEKLVVTLCTTNVHSELPFSCADTNGEWHPYKEYRTIYPDWLIPPDYTREASDYWKYVLVKYNDSFAQEYNAKPADVPVAWRKITKEQALKGLKEAFNINPPSPLRSNPPFPRLVSSGWPEWCAYKK